MTREATGWVPVSLFGMLISCGVVLAVACVIPPGIAAADDCPNEATRLEQGVHLPECRAYELVTPAVKGSGEPNPGDLSEVFRGTESEPLKFDALNPAAGPRSAVDGNRIGWVSEPMPGSTTPGLSHLSARGAGGWTTQSLVPPMSPMNDLLCPLQMGVSGWSQDLRWSVLDLPGGPPAGFFEERECGDPDPGLVAGEPEHFRNLFVHENLTGQNLLVNITPANVVWPEPEEGRSQQYWPASFLAGSDDFRHMVFEEELALTPEAEEVTSDVKEACENGDRGCWEGQDNVYEWTDASVRLVTIRPDGTPARGTLAGATRNYAGPGESQGEQMANTAVNVVQSRHAVSADGSRIYFEADGSLYLRIGGTSTIQVDESEGPDPSGGGRFQLASASGDRVFFTADRRLTSDATAVSGKPDLYEYEVDSGDLTDLTVNASEPADVLGVGGGAEDGSYVYFVARGSLDSDPNAHGGSAVVGEPNLYVLHGNAISYVATLHPIEDRCNWTWNARCVADVGGGLTSRVSRGGEFLGFNSTLSLTGYDNTDENTGKPDIEIFLYSAMTDTLECASCIPNGSQPTAGAAIHWPSLPGRSAIWLSRYPQRNVSDQGHVFFETADALLEHDVNGRRDVYAYVDGKVQLLSTGSGNAGSYFIDASPDGRDVVIATAQRLLSRDIDSVSDYYDVRVDGGFAEPNPIAPACQGEDCRGGSATPATLVPGSALINGGGNVWPGHSCQSFGKRARNLSRRAKALRRNAKKLKGSGRDLQATRAQSKSKRLTKRASRLHRQGKRCRGANWRADK